MFTIHDLSELVPHKIFERGMDCFDDGAVGRIRRAGGEFKAVVQGTEAYHVVLTLRASNPPDIACDCPYDYGPVCKHGVALGLAVLDQFGQSDELPASLAPAAAPETYTTQQLQKALLAALTRVSEKEKIAYLGHLLYHKPNLIQGFMATFEFSVPLLLAVSKPRPRPLVRTFVQVGEELLATGYRPDLLPHLLRYDWRGVPEDEAARLAALLAAAARTQPEATLDAVMERIETYLTSSQRGPGFYPRLVSWLMALYEVPAVAAEVRLFASELWKQHGRRVELRGLLTEAGFAPLPTDMPEEAWPKKAAAKPTDAAPKRRGRAPKRPT